MLREGYLKTKIFLLWLQVIKMADDFKVRKRMSLAYYWMTLVNCSSQSRACVHGQRAAGYLFL